MKTILNFLEIIAIVGGVYSVAALIFTKLYQKYYEESEEQVLDLIRGKVIDFNGTYRRLWFILSLSVGYIVANYI